MNRVVAFILSVFFMLSVASGIQAEETTDQFGRFGKIALYLPSGHPAHVALFVSGDGGWNLGVVDMAREIAALGALVVGIDITYYLKQLERSSESCVYPAADFELLSKYVQKKLNFPQYVTPVLIGYSSGATLVYAVLGQSPTNTFGGAISLGFCPDLTVAKPLCRSNGLEWQQDPKKKNLYLFPPFKHLRNPWIAFQGTIDKVCDPLKTEAFVKQVPNGQLASLPGVGHGFSVPKNWLPQFKRTFSTLTASSPKSAALLEQSGDLTDLPLVEVPTTGTSRPQMAVFLTGDGGWADLDQEVSRELAARGLTVVGLNTLKYFWSARTPDGATADLARILRYYLEHWKKDTAVLIGYSLGADVLPFMAARLPQDLRDRTALIALIGPSKETAFEFHMTDWMGGTSKGLRPVLPEVKHLSGKNLLCLYGKEETDSLCPAIRQSGAQVDALEGAHHFSGNYTAIAEQILKALEK